MSDTFRQAALLIQKVFNRFDRRSAAVDHALADTEAAPIFIISAPRTGSTLVYQYLVAAFRVGYVSNVMSLLASHMLSMDSLGRRFGKPEASLAYRGDYGFLPGLFAPSEAGKVMDKWFDLERVDENREPVRRMVASLARQNGAPLLVKSPSLTQKLKAVTHIFPKARFIVLERQPQFIAQSILIGRQNPDIPPERWVGVEPPKFNEIRNRGLPYQVVWQVAQLVGNIKDGLAEVPKKRIYRLAYEDFCRIPEAKVNEIGKQFGLALRAGAHNLPDQFMVEDGRRVDDETWSAIIAACHELQLNIKPNPEKVSTG